MSLLCVCWVEPHLDMWWNVSRFSDAVSPGVVTCDGGIESCGSDHVHGKTEETEGPHRWRHHRTGDPHHRSVDEYSHERKGSHVWMRKANMILIHVYDVHTIGQHRSCRVLLSCLKNMIHACPCAALPR